MRGNFAVRIGFCSGCLRKQRNGRVKENRKKGGKLKQISSIIMRNLSEILLGEKLTTTTTKRTTFGRNEKKLDTSTTDQR